MYKERSAQLKTTQNPSDKKIMIPAKLMSASEVVFILPNVQDEPRPQLARSVLLGARSVTAVVVGSSAWLGSVVFISYT